MARETWEFQYRGGELARSTERWQEYHVGREAVWDAERERLEATIRSSGMQITDLPMTGGPQINVKIDPTLLGEYQQAIRKRDTHRTAIATFAAWTALFAANPDRLFTLSWDDIEFFGVLKTLPDDA